MQLTPDTEAVLLLCGYFSSKQQGAKPLSLGEYNKLASYLFEHGLRPKDLLANRDALAAWASSPAELERVQRLLGRGVEMSVALERWASQGFWVKSRADSDYPSKLKERLKTKAPVLLYGVGPLALLERSGLAIVGSRDVSEDDLRFTNLLASRAVEEQLSVISGDAKGVDREAMSTALDEGGEVVGFLAHGISKALTDKAYRRHVEAQRLLLLAQVFPFAPWSVGQAMARNKFIYAASDLAVVVRSGMSGGTWAGAQENLAAKWVPLFVRATKPLTAGNAALLEQGAAPIDDRFLSNSDSQQSFALLLAARLARERQATMAERSAAQRLANLPAAQPAQSSLQDAPFDTVWPLLTAALGEPVKPEVLAETLAVTKEQLELWLQRACTEGRVKKLSKPLRYVLIQPPAVQQGLFEN